MRLSYLSQDRADMGEPVKCSARSMAKPTPGNLRNLKKGPRCLLRTKHMALQLFRQTFPSSISTYVDSDFAGCRSTRKSTTGMVQMVGEHAVKHTSDLQGATGLNVSECEYYALTHGAAHGLGLQACMADLGVEMFLQISSDSSAAKDFTSRRGLRRERHVQSYLWLQEQVAAAHLTVEKVRTTQNPADILTKAASRETLERHRKMLGLRHVEAHSSQKDIRQGSLAADPARATECATCGEPADMSRTSTGEFTVLWFCRGCWIKWNAHDDGNANLNTVDEEEFISVE